MMYRYINDVGAFFSSAQTIVDHYEDGENMSSSTIAANEFLSEAGMLEDLEIHPRDPRLVEEMIKRNSFLLEYDENLMFSVVKLYKLSDPSRNRLMKVFMMCYALIQVKMDDHIVRYAGMKGWEYAITMPPPMLIMKMARVPMNRIWSKMEYAEAVVMTEYTLRTYFEIFVSEGDNYLSGKPAASKDMQEAIINNMLKNMDIKIKSDD